MKAVGYTESLPIDDENSLRDLVISRPAPGPRDLLVRIEAVAVNPIDTKVRKRRSGTSDAPVILGWDVAGVVEAVGDEVTLFAPGDEVYYAGALTRQGCNAEYNVVDERLVGRKPKTLDFVQAAALPLTTITAWECLFDRLKLRVGKRHSDDAILIIGAAGGVGSIAVQLARRLTGLTVIGTASRPETREWVERLGAHHVVDHGKPLSEEIARIGFPSVRYILALTHTPDHWDEIMKALGPQGEICMIDETGPNADIMPLKQKAGAIHFEMMFARSSFETPDMIEQHNLLSEVAALVDDGLIKTTLGEVVGPMNAANLRKAHAAIEAGRTIGKLVLTKFEG